MIGETLTLSNVQKRYDTIWAVHGTDLAIEAGEFVSIVGPSGSGKTTLLTMIAGFETPTAGSILVGNRDITALAPNRRGIGMVFQKYALFPHMTVRQNIEFPLRMRGGAKGDEASRRVDLMLELVQLAAFQGRYPHQLSGGQQQRVAVARALVFDPPVLLMDEPLGALDKKLREAMQFEIKRIQERVGATIIYVTHDQEEALTMSDRVAVMHNGRLEQIGRPDDLYSNPDSLFVADFVGTVNFIAGHVCGHDAGRIIIRVGPDAIIHVRKTGREPSGLLSDGAAVTIAARPEQISITHADDARQSTLRGTLEGIVFTGAYSTALVRPAHLPDQVLRIQIPAGLQSLPERGGDVTLNFSDSAIRIFEGQGGDA